MIKLGIEVSPICYCKILSFYSISVVIEGLGRIFNYNLMEVFCDEHDLTDAA